MELIQYYKDDCNLQSAIIICKITICNLQNLIILLSKTPRVFFLLIVQADFRIYVGGLISKILLEKQSSLWFSSLPNTKSYEV